MQSKRLGYIRIVRDRSDAANKVKFTEDPAAAKVWQAQRFDSPFFFTITHTNVRPPSEFRSLCPTTLIRGDREFSGNGPRVFGAIRLARVDRGIDALIKFTAQETKSDWSTVTDYFIVPLITANPNWKIRKISSPLNGESTFDRTIGRYKRVGLTEGRGGISSGGPLKSMAIVGDTDGDDISDNNECSDDLRILAIGYNNIRAIYQYSP